MGGQHRMKLGVQSGASSGLQKRPTTCSLPNIPDFAATPKGPRRPFAPLQASPVHAKE